MEEYFYAKVAVGSFIDSTFLTEVESDNVAAEKSLRIYGIRSIYALPEVAKGCFVNWPRVLDFGRPVILNRLKFLSWYQKKVFNCKNFPCIKSVSESLAGR